MGKSKIEWTEKTWNPITGCSKISAGCDNCYAETMSIRLQRMGTPKYKNGFEVSVHENLLDQPINWKKPSLIFVNSMSDLFHKDVPEGVIQRVIETIQKANWHQFQVLTKRSQRLRMLAPKIDWPSNLWMGVSVENQEATRRIGPLVESGASIKWLSIEPLIGPINKLDLDGIDWVVVGGESGPKARPMKEEWVLQIKEKCDSANVPFFFKQWGGVRKKDNGRQLLGTTFDAMPELKLGT